MTDSDQFGRISDHNIYRTTVRADFDRALIVSISFFTL